MNAMTTLLKRELWEHRGVTWAPGAFGGLFVLVGLLAASGLVTVRFGNYDVEVVPLLESLAPVQAGALFQGILMVLAVTLNMVMLVVTAFYLLDCLFAERKDRTILFWKSLPVSDTMVAGSKLLTAVLVIPLAVWAIFVVTAVALYLVSGLGLLFSGSNSLLLAGPGAICKASLAVVYALVAQSLWYLPIYGWLLLVSAWARRAPLVWAILPPVLVNVTEKLVFGTHHFARLMGERIVGVFPLAFNEDVREDIVWQFETPSASGQMHVIGDVLQLIAPGPLLSSPALYGGLVVAALFFAGAVWLRRYRDDT